MDVVRTGEVGVRELQGRWPGLHWGRWEVRRVFSRRTGALWPSADVGQGKMAGRGRSKRHSNRLARVGGNVQLAGWRVSGRRVVRLGVEWLAVRPGRE